MLWHGLCDLPRCGLSFETRAVTDNRIRGNRRTSGATKATGPRTRDVKHASLIALTKRLHGSATPDLITALNGPDRNVRQCAVSCLVLYGDESAFDAILADMLYLIGAQT
jgi:hypothetical protein